MNLEEIEERYHYRNLNGDFFYDAIVCAEKTQLTKDMAWLISQLRGAGLEIAEAEAKVNRLENMVRSKNPKKWEFKAWIDKCGKLESLFIEAKAKIAHLQREIKRMGEEDVDHLMMYGDRLIDLDYQRRHRKRALHLLVSCREYALAWKQSAEIAEAERDGYKDQIKAADNILATYGVDGPLLYDRVFKLIGRFEAEIERLQGRVAGSGEKGYPESGTKVEGEIGKGAT